MGKLLADWKKLYFDDESYIHVYPMSTIITDDKVSDTKLPNGLYYLANNKLYPLFYLEEFELYEVDDKDHLHFIGYSTDDNIRESFSRRFGNL